MPPPFVYMDFSGQCVCLCVFVMSVRGDGVTAVFACGDIQRQYKHILHTFYSHSLSVNECSISTKCPQLVTLFSLIMSFFIELVSLCFAQLICGM